MPVTLHLICGKIAAGKSTLAANLAQANDAVLIAEDTWLSALFGDQMQTVADYVRCSAKLQAIMGPHITALLQAGGPVVLDFPANTRANRAWMRGISDAAGVGHVLHYVDVPDDVCRARLRARNAAGAHEFTATDAQFEMVTRHFLPPQPDEGFTVKHYAHSIMRKT